LDKIKNPLRAFGEDLKNETLKILSQFRFQIFI
jgi:hypothetical protein